MIEKQESEAKSEREETREKLSHVGNVAKMREALLIIAGGKDARGNYEEVAWHMAQLAAEAIATRMTMCYNNDISNNGSQTP